MKCKLCLRDKPLLRKSHIIPEFMHRELFDEMHRLFKVDLTKKSDKLLQSGEYESNIICKECDNSILGSLEGYAKDLLYGGKNYGIRVLNEKNNSGLFFTSCSGVDYRKFKLFLLSLLWRFSISNNLFYEKVSLGPYEEVLRRMIINGNPGRQLDFPCLMCSYRRCKNLPYQLISQPRRFRHESCIGYSIIIGGVLYLFYIAQPFMSRHLEEVVINNSGTMRIVHLDESKGKQMLQKAGLII